MALFGKKILTLLIILFKTFLITNLFSEEYLDKVINRLNTVENELKNIKNNKNGNNKSKPDLINSIAIHEQRIGEIEEEIRNLTGYLDEINFKLDNIITSLEDNSRTSSIDNDEKVNNVNNQYGQDNSGSFTSEDEYLTNNRKTIIVEDPNKKSNPEMKVLGTIKKEQNTEKTDNLSQNEKKVSEKITKNSLAALNTSEEIQKLSKNPSDIYKYAYDMLIRENYNEAESSFKTFIGEHPKDPLASNAYYWLGETYYVQKKFQLAAISFARGYQNFPKGNKAIDQLFKLALTFMNLGKNEDACASFSKLEIEFPNAPKRISNRAKEYKQRAKCRA